MSERARFYVWDVVYALDMAIACAISYWAITHALQPLDQQRFRFVGRDVGGGCHRVRVPGNPPR